MLSKLTDKMWEAVMHWLVNGSSVDVGIITVGGEQVTAAPRRRPNFLPLTMQNRLNFQPPFRRTVLLRGDFCFFL